MNTHSDHIWSREPAQSWEWAMVSGNGTHGAMVFGEPLEETIVINHERLYLPCIDPGDLLETAADLPTLRRVLQTDGYAAGMVYLDTQASMAGRRPARGTRSFHPACSLRLATRAKGALSDYQRETNYRTGEVKVRFQDDGQAYQRCLFVSRAAACIVLELSADQPGGASYDLSLDELGPSDRVRSEVTLSTGGIALQTSYLHGKAGYDTVVCVAATDGKVTVNDGHLTIHASRQTLLLIRVQPWTTAVGADSEGLLDQLRSLAAPYATLLQAHAAFHSELYDRVSIDLAADDSERQLAIDALLELATASGTLPHALLEKLYNAGRYMNLCCFGELPPNLQGVWTGTWDAPWGGGYVIDTNLQLAIASALSCNQSELYQGYVNLVEEMLPFWRDNARRIYGGPGLFATGCYCPGIEPDGRHKQTYGHWCWLFEAGYAGWAARLLYDYYLHTQDHAFLRDSCLPMLLELVEFYRNWLFIDETGCYRFSPGCSPESAMCDNPTYEIAVAHDVFGMLAEIAGLLSAAELSNAGVTPEAVAEWGEMRRLLPPYLINTDDSTSGSRDYRPYYIDNAKSPLAADGALKEFALPNCAEVYSHRHFSHLYPLFVSGHFTPETTPELWEAARIAVDKRLAHWLHAPEKGDATHRRMHGAICALRFGQGDIAWQILTMIATRGVLYPSLMMSHFDDHRVFNVDGNGALPEIINRMLVESTAGVLTLLPALPATLPRGRVAGIRLKQSISIEQLTWNVQTGSISLDLQSIVDQTLELEIGTQHQLVGITSTPFSTPAGPSANSTTLRLRANTPLSIKLQIQTTSTDISP